MAFVLSSVIKIGQYSFTGGVNDLEINKSVFDIVDTAKLKMPAIGLIAKKQSNLPKNSVQTAFLFKEGDPVSIDLGYNGVLRNEFRGFIRRVTIATPIELEMEGYAWQLRNKNISASWKKTTVKEVLTRIIQGTDIVLNDDIPEIALDSFSISNQTGLSVLGWFKVKMLLTVCFDDNVLYAGLQAGRKTIDDKADLRPDRLALVKYKIGHNIVTNQPGLKRVLSKDRLLLVRLKTKANTGKVTLYEAGDKTGEVFEVTIPFSKDASYLQKLSQSILAQRKFDGYSGGLEAFLQPYCKPGWQAVIADPKYDEARAGSYFINSVTVRFGVRGGRRKVGISYRLDNSTSGQF